MLKMPKSVPPRPAKALPSATRSTPGVETKIPMR